MAFLLQPRKTKFRKSFKGRITGINPKSSLLKFGMIGLKSVENSRLTAKQLETSRKIILKLFKKNAIKHARLWCRVFPSIPVTKKPVSVRMGKGKGSVDH